MSPFLPLILIVGCDVWVYLDATRLERRGEPVVVTFFGSLALDTAAKWLVACVLVFIVCFPVYLVARSTDPTDGG